MKISFVFFALLLNVISCGKVSKTKFDAPKASTVLAVRESLKNGVIPSPDDVKNDTVSRVIGCDEFKSMIPKDWDQGYVEVPENSAQPDGNKIEIFYYGKILPGKTPVVFFNGGPGSSSHSSFKSLEKQKWIMDQKKNISFIYIDQRGNGCSTHYPVIEESVDDDEGEIDPVQKAEILERLSHYGSREIVMDAEAVRKKLLKNNQWIAFGQSYGAYVVHRYANLFPGSLKAAFAHANAINSSAEERFKWRITSQLRVLEEYMRQYPEDRKKIELLNAKLTKKFCVEYILTPKETNDEDDEEMTTEACGYEILYSVYGLLGFSNHWLELHQWIATLVDEKGINKEGISFYLSTINDYTSFEVSDSPFIGGVLSWVDRNTVSGGIYCQKLATDLLTKKVDLAKNGFHDCSTSLQFGSNGDYIKDYAHLKRDLLTLNDFKNSIKNNPNLPFYIYSGQKDAIVPIETFSEEINAMKGMKNFIYKNFTGTGHDGYFTEPLIWQNISIYI
jgi:pimeloyl-ACP methyl ester carboxylesterase